MGPEPIQPIDKATTPSFVFVVALFISHYLIIALLPLKRERERVVDASTTRQPYKVSTATKYQELLG
jgi:hypothetical protein